MRRNRDKERERAEKQRRTRKRSRSVEVPEEDAAAEPDILPAAKRGRTRPPRGGRGGAGRGRGIMSPQASRSRSLSPLPYLLFFSPLPLLPASSLCLLSSATLGSLRISNVGLLASCLGAQPKRKPRGRMAEKSQSLRAEGPRSG